MKLFQTVYTISRRNGLWKVNSKPYKYCGEGSAEGYIKVKLFWTAYGTPEPVNKRERDVFPTKEEAENECIKRNLNET